MFRKKKETEQPLSSVEPEYSGTVIEKAAKQEKKKSAEKTSEIQKRKVSRKKDKLMDEMKYIVPSRLRKSIENYGYRMSTKNFILYHIVALLALFGAAYMLQLKIAYVIILIVEVLICIPMFVHDKYKRQYYADEFEDASKYVENILYAFNKTGKIKESLNETIKIFPEGNMHDCIERALQSINNGEFYDISRKNLYATALEYIEKEYPSKRIINAHRLMTTTEMDGGEYRDTVKVLMNDRRVWSESTKKMMTQKEKKFSELVISAVTSGFICIATNYVYRTLPDEMNITAAPLAQLGSLFLLFMLVLIVKYGSSKWTTDWVKVDALNVDDNALEDYEYILNFNEAAERKKSVILSIPFFLLAGLIYMMHVSWYYYAIMAAIGVLCLFLPKLLYRVYYKSVIRNIQLAFPTWLLQLSNLLQENNVVNALQKSKEIAPLLMIPEIDDLLTRISETPGDVRTYTEFFGFFNLTEIKSAMQVLFAIAESGNEDVKEQMQTLIDTNCYLQQQAEEITAENVILSMKNLFQIPMLIASAKLVADLFSFITVALPALATLQ